MSEGKLLIIDDNVDYVNTKKKLFERDGYEVEVATSYEAGLQALREKTFDVALIDVRLRNDDDVDDTSGIELARSIVTDMPIIILSQHDTVEYVHDALQQTEAGTKVAVDYVLKTSDHELHSTSVRHAMQTHPSIKLRQDVPIGNKM